MVGQRIQVAFTLEDPESINVTCEIMWRRASSRPSAEAGVGVRFLNLSDTQRSAVEEYVRKHKLMGFMPWNAEQPSGRQKRAQA